MPGFLDSRLHRALSSQTRFQIVNVAHSANPALYQVVVDYGDPQQA